MADDSGVYAIRLNDEIAYIGSSISQRNRVRNHIASMKNRTNTPSLNGLWAEHSEELSAISLYTGGDYRAEEKRLIAAYDPMCNVVGSKTEYDGELVYGNMRKITITMPDDLYQEIAESAKLNMRTVSGEIVYRLKMSFMERQMNPANSPGISKGGVISQVGTIPEPKKEETKVDEEWLYEELIAKIGESMDRDVSYDERQELNSEVKSAGLVFNAYLKRLEKFEDGKVKIIHQY